MLNGSTEPDVAANVQLFYSDGGVAIRKGIRAKQKKNQKKRRQVASGEELKCSSGVMLEVNRTIRNN